MIIETQNNKSAIGSASDRAADTGLKHDLMLFWHSYPEAEFTLSVIARGLDCSRRADVEEAVESLVQAQVLDRRTCHGVSLYALRTGPAERQLASDSLSNARHFRPFEGVAWRARTAVPTLG
ncbi:MAG: hypothetical protein NTU41_02940 [Chloroflexi bacterium]|nr:hypothetical protein [Chloroflexota bacterium]